MNIFNRKNRIIVFVIGSFMPSFAVTCLMVYAGMGYYPFDSFSGTLMKWLGYIIIIPSCFAPFIALLIYSSNIIQVFKNQENRNEKSKAIKYLLIVIVNVVILSFLIMSEAAMIVVGRGIIGAICGLFLFVLPFILIVSNNKNMKKVKIAAFNYLLQNQEIIDFVGGVENLIIEEQSISYSAKEKAESDEGEAIMVVYNKNDKSNKGLIVNLKLSISANENTWQVTEMTYAKQNEEI